LTRWPYPRLIAHRGGGHLAPENTLAAVRVGQVLGYRMIEVDAKLSADGVAMLLHDATLDRTTEAEGPASALAWAHLQRLDAGLWHSEAFSGERIPSLESLAALCRAGGVAVNIEIKPSPGQEAYTGEAVARFAAQYWRGAEIPPLMSSFSRVALESAGAAVPGLPRALIAESPTDDDLAFLAHIDAVSLHSGWRAATPALLERVHQDGRRLLVWTVNDPPAARALFEAGVDGVITDNLRQFARRFPDRL
jgi:glycerophosphoryl diester phosphodiesterase